MNNGVGALKWIGIILLCCIFPVAIPIILIGWACVTLFGRK